MKTVFKQRPIGPSVPLHEGFQEFPPVVHETTACAVFSKSHSKGLHEVASPSALVSYPLFAGCRGN